jgi:hypothetical protein
MRLKRTALRLGAVAATGALVVGGLGLTTSAASAAEVVGTATTSIQAGTTSSTFAIYTPTTCPSGDRLITTISGTGFPSGGYNIGGNVPASSSRFGSGYKIEALETFATMASENAFTIASGTTYTITVSCVTGLSTVSSADFTTPVYFYSATQWANTAAVFGTASVTPATGTKDSTVSIGTTKLCPAGNKIQVAISGSGFPSGGYNVTGKDDVATKVQGAGYTLPLLQTLAAAAADQTPPATLSGKYTFGVSCYNGLDSNKLSTTSAAIYFTDSTNYQTVPVGTTATLAVTGLSGTQVAPNRPVTLTASLSTAGGVPAGVVEFFDGSTSLGSAAVTAGASGVTKTAQIVKSNFADGAHTVKATFTPTSSDFSAVTTATSSFTVQVPTTSTVLAVSPTTTAQQYAVVTLNATVTPSDAAGRVVFSDGTTELGRGNVSGGVASLSVSTFAVGSHTLKATFTPTDAQAFTTSSSADVAYTITARPGPAPVTQTVRTTISSQGALTISLVQGADGLVDLGSPTLNSAADRLVATGAIDNVTITDTRTAVAAGGVSTPGFSVSAQMSNFTSAGGNSIPAAYVGITPSVSTVSGITGASAGTVTAASAVGAESPLSGVTKDLTNGGLAGDGASLAVAPAGFRGTAIVSGSLTIEVPTSTAPDTYESTLTLTVL